QLSDKGGTGRTGEAEQMSPTSAAGDWRIVQDADDQTAYDALAVDRLWNGYGIADLVPPFRPYTRVAVARRGASPPEAACLVLRHPAYNALIPHGDADRVSPLLRPIELPER